MQTPARVVFRDMPVSDAVEARCWKEAEKLERYFDRIIGCQVTIAASHRRHQQGNLFEVRISLELPGSKLVVNRAPAEHHVDEEIDVAIREAFDRMRRQLQDQVRRMRGQVKHHENEVEERLVAGGAEGPTEPEPEAEAERFGT